MTPEHWQEIERLFEAALACPPDQRRSFLVDACQGNATLLTTLEDMLLAHEHPEELSEVLEMSVLSAGTRLGPYEVVSLVGSGGMGDVYKARDTRLDRTVAIKVISPLGGHDQELRLRFEREARAVASLNHPHICTLFDVDSNERLSFFVMEYLEGATLAEKLAEGPLTQDDALRVAIEIAEALDAAHRQGITHRDLKPANIMLTGRGAKLLDFGIAKLTAPHAVPLADAEGLTRTGVARGTLHYMAPEQLEGRPTDARTDIYAFGAVLYEMLTGRKAFKGATTLTPPSLDRVVTRCLARDPKDRWPSSQALLAELRRLSDTAHRDRTGVRIARRIAVAVVAPLVVAGALLYGLWPRASTPTSVAVLPFVNATEDPSLDYLSEGLTDGLSNTLSRIEGLRVAPRTLVSRYATQQADVETIARTLSVEAVVTGRITKRADTVTVAAELIDVQQLSQLWGAQYRSSSLGVLDVEKAMAVELAGRLQRGLTGRDTEQMIRRYADSPEAYQAYLQGQHYLKARTAEGYTRSIGFFEQAIAKDPSYALAYAGLAETFTTAGYFSTLPPSEAYPKAKTAALRALELDDELAEAHSALAAVQLYYEWNFPSAEQRYKEALALDSTLASAIMGYSAVLAAYGRLDDAISEARRAEQLDPVSPGTIVNAGWLYYYGGQHDRAMEQVLKTFELSPNFITSGYLLSQVILATNRPTAEMRETLQQYRVNTAIANAQLAYVEAVRGTGRVKQDYLASLKGPFEAGRLPAFAVASISAALGYRSETLDWLEQAYKRREGPLVWLDANPDFASVRSDPRYLDLVRRIGLRP